jgi:hypothetical protein
MGFGRLFFLFGWFEAVVHAGEATVGLVAGHINELAFLLAGWTGLRRCGLNYRIAAVAAFPGVIWKGRFALRHGIPPFLPPARGFCLSRN